MLIRFITSSPSGKPDELAVQHDHIVRINGRDVLAMDAPANTICVTTVHRDGADVTLWITRTRADVARVRRVMGAERHTPRAPVPCIGAGDTTPVADKLSLDTPKGRVTIVVASDGSATIVDSMANEKKRGEFLERYERMLNECTHAELPIVVDSLACIGFAVRVEHIARRESK